MAVIFFSKPLTFERMNRQEVKEDEIIISARNVLKGKVKKVDHGAINSER